jgi:hypothetical protein
VKVNLKRCTAAFLLAPFLLFAVVLGGCSEKTSVLPEQAQSLEAGEWLTLSVFDTAGKSGIWLVNTKTGKLEQVIRDREVMLNGELSSSGEWVAFADALEDRPWDAFLLNTGTRKVYQVTHDELGQFQPRFGDQKGQLIFAKVGGLSSPVPKIAKIDLEHSTQTVLDNQDPDRSVEAFDVSEDQIIAATFSQQKDDERYQEANEKGTPELAPLTYRFLTMQLEGTDLREVATVKATQVDSVEWSSDRNLAIFTGKDVNGDRGEGIYLLSLQDGKVERLLGTEELQQAGGIAERLGNQRFANLAFDHSKLYFVAVPRGESEKTFAGLTFFPSAVYSYDLQGKQIQEVFRKQDTIITGLSLTVVK